MKKTYLFLFFAVATLFTISMSSCSETDNNVEEYPNWQATNESYFNNVYTAAQKAVNDGDASWKLIRSWSLLESVATKPTDYVVVEVKNGGTGSGCPLYTDSVKVHVRARLLPSTSYAKGYVFAQSFSGDEVNPNVDAPMTLGVAQGTYVPNGLSTALQQMHIGDHWMVTVPYQLGYGTTTYTTPVVEAYSTLLYDVTLVGYFRKTNTASAPSIDGNTTSVADGYWVYE